jgi:hypothetical protein
LQHMVDNCVPVEQGDYNINTCKNNPLAKEDYEQAAMGYARVAMHETLTECVGLQGGVSVSLFPFFQKGRLREQSVKSRYPPAFPFPVDLEASERRERRSRYSRGDVGLYVLLHVRQACIPIGSRTELASDPVFRCERARHWQPQGDGTHGGSAFSHRQHSDICEQ